MCESEKVGLPELEITAIFGYNGKVPCSLQVHPDQIHLVFPLGNKVSILNYATSKQEFLCGHTNVISTVKISPSGKYIASGQVSYMGFRSFVILWDWETRSEILRHDLHKVHIQCLSFSSNEHYLISLGGQDDKLIAVWNIEKNCAFAAVPATREVSGCAKVLSSLHRRWGVFLSGGEDTLRLWGMDMNNNRLKVYDVAIGKLKREFTGMRINTRDELLYVGTTTGDVCKISLNCYNDPNVFEREKAPNLLGCYALYNPKKPKGQDCEKFKNGVRDIIILASGDLIVGAGDGSIYIVEERNVCFKDYKSPTWPKFKVLNSLKVNSAVSSLQLMNVTTLLIGTEGCEIYSVKVNDFNNTLELYKTCPTNAIYDIAFPKNLSLVFATGTYESIRVWGTSKMQELLRIMVPNFSCKALEFNPDGKAIISGWDDGVIRSFTPLTGKLIFAIPNSHNKGCTCLSINSNGKMIVSGGSEGQVRVWRIEPHKQYLYGVLKEHKGPISSVHINKYDSEAISSSSDGTCIIWDLLRMTRKHILFANTQFTCARYFPTAIQIITSGSDRRINYYESYNGNLVRDVEGSKTGAVNCLDLNRDGDYFVSVGNDQIVRLWDYQQGAPLAAGYGHSGQILSCRYSPDSKFLVSGSTDGGVYIWKVPDEYLKAPEKKPIKKEEDTVSTSSQVTTGAPKKNRKPDENINQLGRTKSPKSGIIIQSPSVDKTAQPLLDKCLDAASLCGDDCEIRSQKSNTSLRCK